MEHGVEQSSKRKQIEEDRFKMQGSNPQSTFDEMKLKPYLFNTHTIMSIIT